MKFSLGSSKPSPKISLGKPKAPSTLGKRPRSNVELGDESDSEDERLPAAVAVTGFSASGAEARDDDRPKQKALVIERLGNKDWRGDIRRRNAGKNLLPPEVQAQRAAAARSGDVEVPQEEEIKWGLTVKSKEEREKEAEERAAREANREVKKDDGEMKKAEIVERVKTEDEMALDALLGKSSKPKGPDLVIKSGPDTTYTADTEGDAYHRAIAAAPDVSTLEDYERVPVEDFGAALLRGMGWKGEKVAQPKEGKRRLNLLGLGAKELKGAEELGAWVQKSDTKRLNSGGQRRERRETASEFREKEDRRRREREERYGGDRRDDRRDDRRSGERDSRDYRDRDRDRRR